MTDSKDNQGSARSYTGSAAAAIQGMVDLICPHADELDDTQVNEVFEGARRLFAAGYRKPSGDAPAQPAPVRVTNEMIDAAVEAAWPGPEIVYDDNFDGPKAMMRAALEAALSLPSTERDHG